MGGGRGGKAGGGRGGGGGGAGSAAAAAAAKLAAEEEKRVKDEAAARERARLEELERARAEQERIARDEAEAKARLEEMRRVKEARGALRKLNLDPRRPDAAKFKSMDSSIKRNTTLTKKLRGISEESRAGIVDDLRKVNISKYVTEAVAAAVEGKLKATDVPAAVEVISVLHQTYADFSAPLAEALPRFVCPEAKAFAPSAKDALAAAAAAAAAGEGPAEMPTPLQRRLKLRLLAELHLVGVIPSAGPVHKCVLELSKEDYLKNPDAYQHSLSTLSSFAKLFREEYMGFAESPARADAADNTGGGGGGGGGGKGEACTNGKEGGEATPYCLTPERQEAFRKVITSFYNTASDNLVGEHRALQRLECENARALERTGELSESASSAYANLRKTYDALLKGVTSLSEALELAMPELPTEKAATQKSKGELELQRGVDVGDWITSTIWDDEESKTFYEDLPDLRNTVPAVLLPKEEAGAGADAAVSVPSEGVSEAVTEGRAEQKAADAKEDAAVGANHAAKVEELLRRLPSCVFKDAADAFSVDFCFLNATPSARRRLVHELVSVPRSETQRLPFYARIAATLASVFTRDIKQPIAAALEEEFNVLMARRKDQSAVHLDERLKNARFMGECAKFKMVSCEAVFKALKALLQDFEGYNVDVACAMLETCGRFLVKRPDTTERVGALLDIFVRLKSAKGLDGRHAALVDGAYNVCRPPEHKLKRKVRPPIQEYIRHLIFTVLAKGTLPHVVRQMRKLPWAENERYVVKCLLKVYRGRFSHIPLVAELLAALGKVRDTLVVKTVDAVLEDVRFGLETNKPWMHQRRVATMRLLGELYNAKIITSTTIFSTLYLLISFGHESVSSDSGDKRSDANDGGGAGGTGVAGDGGAGWALDAPDDTVRVRLVCVLLETCGHHLDRGTLKKMLDRYLSFFQRYCLSKDMTLDISYDVADLLSSLRPKLAPHETYEAAAAECARIEEDEARALGGFGGGGGGGGGGGMRSLEDIAEDEGEEGDSNDDDSGDDSDEDDDSASEGSDDDERDADEEMKDGDEEEETDSDEEAVIGPHSGVMDEPEERVKRVKPKVSREDEMDFEREMAAFLGPAARAAGSQLAAPSASAPSPAEASHVRPRDADGGGATGGVSGTVAFKMLVKKDGKQASRELAVPASADFVARAREAALAEERERAELKRLVLASADLDDSDFPAVPKVQNLSQPVFRGHARGEGGGRGGRGGRPVGGRKDTGSGLEAGLQQLLERGGGHRAYSRE